MLSAEDYLQRIEAFILDAGGAPVREGIISVTPDDTEGALTLAVGYPSGEALYVEIAIDTSHGWPNWTRYAFQMRDSQNRTIFCYDNFPYHPDVSTFLGHYHLGEEEWILPHPRPTLRDVMATVRRTLDGYDDRRC